MTKNISIIGTPNNKKGNNDIKKALSISDPKKIALLAIKISDARLKPKK